jgi:ATP-dependent helicase/DNAse subunit B
MTNIEVFTGPYRTGKSVKLLERLLDYLETNRPGEALLVVPSQRYRRLITERLLALVKKRQADGAAEHRDFPGVFGLKILSFYKLLEENLRRLGVSFRLMPERVRPVLLQQILLNMKEEGALRALEPIIEFNGTSQQIIELIDEFERAALSPEDVIVRLEKNVETGSKYMELARIYERYWQELDRLGYVDQRIVSFKLREKLTTDKDIDLNLGFLAVDGFDRFNPLQLQAVQLLAPYCKKVEVLFDYLRPEDDPNNDYLWKDDSFKDLENIFSGSLNINSTFQPAVPVVAPDVPVLKTRKRKQGGSDNSIQLSLFAMADSLGRTTPGEADAAAATPRTYTVEKFRTMDRYFELDFIASRIKQRLVSDEIQPSDMLVVIRDLKQYRTAVRSAFENSGIPHYLDESIELLSLPLAQWYQQLLTLSVSNFPRSETIKFLRSPYTRLAAFGLTREEVETLDKKSANDFAVVTGRDQWEDCARLIGSVSLKTALGNFFDQITPPSDVRPHEQWVSWVEDIFEICFASPEGDKEDEVPLHRWQRETTLSAVRQSLALLIKESTIIAGQTFSYAEFARKLVHMLEQSTYRSPGEGQNQVRICSAELAPNKTFSDIYLAGLVEGEFPRRMSRSGFASPEEIKKWKFFGVDLHNPRHHAGFESALFNSLLERARERIVITCPTTDIVGGEELIPSFLLTGGKEEGLRSILTVDPFSTSTNLPVSVKDLVANRLWRNQNSAMVAMTHPDVAAYTEKISSPVAMLKARESGASHLIYNGWLTDLVTSGSLKVNMPNDWSSSRLNDYGKCPFKYWMNHVLRVEPHEEPTHDLVVTTLGETYHKALELFYIELKNRNQSLMDTSDEDIERILESVAKTAIVSMNARADVKRGEFAAYENQEIVFRLTRFIGEEKRRELKEQGRFRPTYFEHGFGSSRKGEEASPPLTIKADGKEIKIVGVIDRIDVAAETTASGHSKVRVVDYKSGATPITEKDTLAGRNLQMAIYAMAVSQSILPGAEVECGQFLSISKAGTIGSLEFIKKKKKPKDGEPEAQEDEVENILDKSRDYIIDYVSRISRGDFEVKPNGEVSCRGCPHSMICRITESGSSAEDEE